MGIHSLGLAFRPWCPHPGSPILYTLQSSLLQRSVHTGAGAPTYPRATFISYDTTVLQSTVSCNTMHCNGIHIMGKIWGRQNTFCGKNVTNSTNFYIRIGLQKCFCAGSQNLLVSFVVLRNLKFEVWQGHISLPLQDCFMFVTNFGSQSNIWNYFARAVIYDLFKAWQVKSADEWCIFQLRVERWWWASQHRFQMAQPENCSLWH